MFIDESKVNRIGTAVTFFMILVLYLSKCICIPNDDQMDIEVENNGEFSNEQVQTSTFQLPDEKWTTTALKDVAYYLRNYKFNEWDRRYYNDKPKKAIGFFGSFPVPPLRTLHWQVYENCNTNFYKCLTYLHGIISTAPFTRSDDTMISLHENEIIGHVDYLENLYIQCKKALLNSENSGLPFDSYLEKFKWQTTASYYMCWFTMLGTPALSMLGESCNNHANCLDPIYGYHNSDIRTDDRLPFACATYSFCPDHCCPIRHLISIGQCNDNIDNPCYAEKADEHSKIKCVMDRKVNQNFEDIIVNRWNVSCTCKEQGFVWKSRFGMCVDRNECITGHHTCNKATEDCLNLPGTFQCICKWGFLYNKKMKTCVQSKIERRHIKMTDGKHQNTIMGSTKKVSQFLGFMQ